VGRACSRTRNGVRCNPARAPMVRSQRLNRCRNHKPLKDSTCLGLFRMIFTTRRWRQLPRRHAGNCWYRQTNGDLRPVGLHRIPTSMLSMRRRRPCSTGCGSPDRHCIRVLSNLGITHSNTHQVNLKIVSRSSKRCGSEIPPEVR